MATTQQLAPRDYQREIFHKAVKGNVIAWMSTGTGKTFIAVMLIRWMAAQIYDTRKVVVFLAPTSSLVHQQADFIRSQTSLVVRAYTGMQRDTGGQKVDTWNHSKWEAQFRETDVLVMTPGLLEIILNAAFWSLDKVSLLIFDEVHHCKKEHLYRRILRNSYHTMPRSSADRPKIFGMTASVIWQAKEENALEKLRAQVLELETSTDCKVHEIMVNANELSRHSHKPVEKVIYYPSDPGTPYTTPSLFDHLTSQGILMALTDTTTWGERALPLDSLQRRYEAALWAFGTYGADAFLWLYLQERMSGLKAYVQGKMLGKVMLGYARADLTTSVSNGDGKEVEAKEADESEEEQNPLLTLDALQSSLSLFSPHFTLPLGCTIPSTLLSPKMHHLISSLLSKRKADFQGIIFVEQRHIATTLCWLLSRIEGLSEWVRPEALIGHGEVDIGGSSSGMGVKEQQGARKRMRSGEINLLCATAVAEEGLDFPGCDLIIRFDALAHIVGYQQSRGRARRPDSTYVVMINNENEGEKRRYQEFIATESAVRMEYERKFRSTLKWSTAADAEDEEDDMDQDDEDESKFFGIQDCYRVESTGAQVTPDSAIALLTYFCSIIRQDAYTSDLKPFYDIHQDECGSYTATVRLPSALPLQKQYLEHEGSSRRSKRAAKASAAFEAITTLHALGVLDDRLLPVVSTNGEEVEDADGNRVEMKKGEEIPNMVDVGVVEPWKVDGRLYLHPLRMKTKGDSSPSSWAPVAALVTGTQLDPLDLTVDGMEVEMLPPIRMLFQSEVEEEAKKVMEKFTECGIAWTISGKRLQSHLTCYLVPLLPYPSKDGAPMLDYDLMRKALPLEGKTSLSIGEREWDHSAFTRSQASTTTQMILANIFQYGRSLQLMSIRTDLAISANHPDDSEGVVTYGQYFEKYAVEQYGNKVAIVETDHLLEVWKLKKVVSSKYSLPHYEVERPQEETPQKFTLLPKSFLSLIPIPSSMIKFYGGFPSLVQKCTDNFRAKKAIEFLGLEGLQLPRVVEALMLPSSNAGFSNQRLETLGDAVLKLATVVHVFNKYPNKHEGQLSALKQNSISNRVLMLRGWELGIVRFMTVEGHTYRQWRATAFNAEDVPGVGHCVRRRIPRRSIQDCMESLVGAAFCSGGLGLSLEMGTRLGLCFGGIVPWTERYEPRPPVPTASLFAALESRLGYKFNCGSLIQEASTHSSFDSADVPCYQRLELLGDALIDMVVTEYLFDKFPRATSGQLTWARSRSVCSASLALIAVRELALHTFLLHNNIELGQAISHYLTIFESVSYKDTVLEGWKYDPPKVLSDLTESVIAAVFVDSGYDYALCTQLICKIFADLLETVSPELPRDPASELMMWVNRNGCRKIRFKRLASDTETGINDSVTVIVHDTQILTPIQGISLPVLKCIAAQQAMCILQSQDEFSLFNLCNCKVSRNVEREQPIVGHVVEEAMGVDIQKEINSSIPPPDLAAASDETVEGFHEEGQKLVEIFSDEVADPVIEEEADSDDEDVMEVDVSLSVGPDDSGISLGI